MSSRSVATKNPPPSGRRIARLIQIWRRGASVFSVAPWLKPACPPPSLGLLTVASLPQRRRCLLPLKTFSPISPTLASKPRRSTPPLFTVEESQALRGEIPGGHAKNLFVKDKKGRLFLLVLGEATEIDLKRVHERIGGQGRVTFGSADLLEEVWASGPARRRRSARSTIGTAGSASRSTKR